MPIIREIRPQPKAIAVGSVPAFGLLYQPGGTWSADINVAAANTLRIVGGGITTDFDLTNAAYDTIGELLDAVLLISGWKVVWQAPRARATYSTILRLNNLTAATTGLGVPTGVFATFVVGGALLGAGLGPEFDSGLPFLARRSKANLGLTPPPGGGDTDQAFTPARLAIIRTAAANPTFSSGTVAWNLYSLSESADTLLWGPYIPGTATTVETALGETQFGEGIQSNIGERLWLELTVGVASLPSAGSILIGDGAYGEPGGNFPSVAL